LTELSIDDPCVLFAVRRESQAFCREFRPQQRFPGAPGRARFCGPEWLSVLVVETGIGPERAAEAVAWLLGRPALEQVPYRPKVVIAAGFAGALQANLAVGDVVLATEVVDADGRAWPTTWPGELPPGDWRPPLHRGRVLSVPRLVGTCDDKRALGRQHNALAVDMESVAVAELCRKHDVPFGCVRAISDPLDTPLSPRLLALLAGSAVSPVKVAAALVQSPALARELWGLAKATRLAAVRLQQALGELLTLTLSWGKEL
jgi:adenosylhomocysteine nucleosidase